MKLVVAAVSVPVSVGLADITTLPVPVMALDTKVLDPLEKTGSDAVKAETMGPRVKVD